MTTINSMRDPELSAELEEEQDGVRVTLWRITKRHILRDGMALSIPTSTRERELFYSYEEGKPFHVIRDEIFDLLH